MSTEMTDSKPGFTELMRRVREGSQDALSELVEEYQHHILHAVRRQLSKRLRSKFDSVDFQQAVWVSFFANRSQIEQFTSPEQLIGFLTTMARHKVINEFRRRLGGIKHNINIEHSLDSSLGGTHTAHQPTASQVAIANERLTELLHNQSARHREMVALRREGNTNKEIAERLGLNERTVRRFFARLAAKHLT